jgi:serine protease Do
MLTLPSTRKEQRALSMRRLTLLATISTVAVVALAVEFGGTPRTLPPLVSNAEAAVDTGQHSAGFGDLVEKVKPAVVSVRVKLDASPEPTGIDGNSPSAPNSPMDHFFRRFGMPDGGSGPDAQRQPRNRPATAQGSGFFITPDGYAVTNNHVVENAKSVEIRTDDARSIAPRSLGQTRVPMSPLSKSTAAAISPMSSLRTRPRGSATGSWRSAIRSALAEP